MISAKEERHASIRALEKESFQAENGFEDINVLIQSVYREARAEGILQVVMLQADLPLFGLNRVATKVAPQEPEPDANQTAMRAYDQQQRMFMAQDKSLREVQHKLALALDRTATLVIAEPVFGTLRRTTLQTLTLLKAAYATMTHRELANIDADWRTMRWDPSQDLCQFMAEFTERADFLTQHAFGSVDGIRVTTLINAIRHQVTFADMANPVFYQAHPLAADQTLANLTAAYAKVYRGQYERTTADQHHRTANQALKEDPHEEALAGIMASVRGSLAMMPAITHTQLMDVQAAVAKAVVQCLRPEKDQQPTASKSGGSNKKGPPCHHKDHYGPLISHTWKECRLNPQSVNYQAQK